MRPLWKQRLFSRLQNQQSAEGGEGGGGAPAITPEVQALIDSAVATATTGLKNKTSELLGSLKAAKETLGQFEGIDPAAMRAMMKQFSDSEEAGLLAAGKLDEVVGKRVDRMKSDYDKKLATEADSRTKAEAKASKLAARTLAGAIRDAAMQAGALPEAMEDIVLRGGNTWHLNDDGDPVAMNGDEVVLSKDGKTPLTPKEWAESLREAAPHLWPKAQGANAQGSIGNKANQPAGNFGGNRADRIAAINKKFNLSKG